jgi:ParB-like chromosome segregation protein Spo0J
MITEIKIESIKWDKLPINPSVLRLVDFIRSGGEIPPIHLQRSSQGGYKLKDGRHRVSAYKLLGIKTIKSRINDNKILYTKSPKHYNTIKEVISNDS